MAILLAKSTCRVSVFGVPFVAVQFVRKVLFKSSVAIAIYQIAEPTYVPAATPVSTSPDMVEWTLDDDGEPDMEFPQPVLGEKGVKIERLTTLRQDGGLVNYQNWLSDVNRAFKADPARFNAAVKRIVFATSWFDSKMKSIWVSESKKRQDHWLKILRWLDKTHLHGESDLIYQLNLYQEAVQGPNEEPTAFYSRLTTLSDCPMERKLRLAIKIFLHD